MAFVNVSTSSCSLRGWPRIQMLDAQSKAQSQNTTLTNAFFSKNNNNN